MFYIVYTITNKINGKIYIGTHATNRLYDGYMGSGTLIRRAIKKYGVENFEKDIPYIFDNAQDMFDREAELVNEDFVARKDTYNLKTGGQGGFTLTAEQKSRRAKNSYDTQRRLGIGVHSKESKDKSRTKLVLLNKLRAGVVHRTDTKEQMSRSHQGKHDGPLNSQYGTAWVSNSNETIKISLEKLDHYMQLGYVRGRKKVNYND